MDYPLKSSGMRIYEMRMTNKVVFLEYPCLCFGQEDVNQVI